MSQYFENDSSVKKNEKKVMNKIKNETFSFYVDNGVFSKKGLDFGTRSLLENLDLEEIKGDVLDFGCGYGPIGIYIAKQTSSKVDMIDINERALRLAEKNAKENQVNVHIYESNLYEKVEKKYDFIITNPPIRVGKTVLYQILLGAKKYLKKEGQLLFVIHKDQGAKSTMKMLEKEYSVSLITKNKGFYVIRAKND